MAGNDKKVDYN